MDSYNLMTESLGMVDPIFNQVREAPIQKIRSSSIEIKLISLEEVTRTSSEDKLIIQKPEENNIIDTRSKMPENKIKSSSPEEDGTIDTRSKIPEDEIKSSSPEENRTIDTKSPDNFNPNYIIMASDEKTYFFDGASGISHEINPQIKKVLFTEINNRLDDFGRHIFDVFPEETKDNYCLLYGSRIVHQSDNLEDVLREQLIWKSNCIYTSVIKKQSVH
jgi:hypothetical protein